MAHQNNLPIHKAAAAGLKSEVISLCSNRDLVNAANYLGWTPVMIGTYFGHMDVVKVLLSLGADISFKNRFGGDVYTLAAASGNVGIMRILHCHHGMNAGQLSKSLAVAVTFGHLSLVRFLIDNGADPNSQTKDSGVVPLMLAVVENQYEIVQFLVHRGADITYKNLAGYSALQLARIENKMIESFFLEKLGIDLECEPAYATCQNKEAVAQAARSGDLYRLKSLLSQNPSLSSSQHWMTSFDEENGAGFEDDDVFVSSEDLHYNLMQKQINASHRHTYLAVRSRNDKDFEGDLLNLYYSPYTSSFLYNALADRKYVKNKFCESKSEIVEPEVTTPVKHNTGELYLSVASKMNVDHSKKMVSNIIGSVSNRSISEVAAGDEEGIAASPLILACFNGHVEAARLLIAAGADPNRQRRGRTPLMLAAITSNMELALLLLSAGADPHVESHVDRLTALELASLSGADTEVLRLIAIHTYPNVCDDFYQTKSLHSLDTPLKLDAWRSPRRILSKLQSVISPRLHGDMVGQNGQHLSGSQKSMKWTSPLKKVKKTPCKTARKLFSSPVCCIALGKDSSEKMKNLQRCRHAFSKSPESTYAPIRNIRLSKRPFDTPFVSCTSDKISEVMPPPFMESRQFNIIEEAMLKTSNMYFDNNAHYEVVKDKNSSPIPPESLACSKDATLMDLDVISCTPMHGHLEGRIQICVPSKKNSNNATYTGGHFEEFIERHDLQEYSSLFRKNEVTDIEILLSIDEDDLQEMGVMNPEERRNVLSKIHFHYS